MASLIPIVPSFDAHCWVVDSKGVIWDPEFPNYNFIKTINACHGPRVYRPAPLETQEKIITIFHRFLTTMLNRSWSSIILYLESQMTDGPRFGHCFYNAFVHAKNHGGTIVVGSMGWERMDGSGVHFEYGGADWNTLSDHSSCCVCRVKAVLYCSGCGVVCYCSRRCQQFHWKDEERFSHKKHCKVLKLVSSTQSKIEIDG